MIVLKVPELVDNDNLPFLNELLFSLKANGTKTLAVNISVFQSCNLSVKSGDALFYGDASATILLGRSYEFVGSLNGKLWVKYSSDSQIGIASKFDISEFGFSTAGLLNDTQALQMDVSQFAGSTKIKKALPTYALGVYGNIEAFKDNEAMTHIGGYLTAMSGSLNTTINKSKATIKHAILRGTGISINLDLLSGFLFETFEFSKHVSGDMKYLLASNIAVRDEITGVVHYTGNAPFPHRFVTVNATVAFMHDVDSVNYFRDITASTWHPSGTLVFVFKNTGNAIIDSSGNITNPNIISYVNALKAKGVTVTINGVAR